MKKTLLFALPLSLLVVLAGCSTAGAGKMKNTPTVLFDGRTLDGWQQIPAGSWTVTNGAMASLGLARGVIYTTSDYGHYRLTFSMRHISGNKDHQPCFLIFCTRPTNGEKPLDALGGIQFQVPNGGHWDYRKGHNNGGETEFTTLLHPKFNNHEWSRVEIVVDAARGVARMAVAQPVGSRAVEVLDFNDPAAGKIGPVAWQMHNRGLFDEYKDVTIEADPKNDELVTTR